MIENGEPRPDENGFVTAQVLRALGPLTADQRLGAVVSRALDFLERCEDAGRPWAYRFWPEGTQPTHLPAYPADADDSSVIPMELARHGRRDRDALRRTVLLVLIRHRVAPTTRLPASWVRPGVFYTWLDASFGYNVVDCTVNANVVALMSGCQLTHIPGYAESCEMIESGVEAAGGNATKTRLLSPYYTHPVDLLYAVRHAVDSGVDRFGRSLSLLDSRWGNVQADEARPVFSSAYGRVVWLAPVLQRVRRWTQR